MNDSGFNTDLLIRLQRLARNLFLVYFAAVSLAWYLGLELKSQMADWGIILILFATIIKLLVMTEQFRKIGMIRIWMLGYALLLVLLSTVILEYLL